MVHTDLGRYHPLFGVTWPLRRALLPSAATGAAAVVHAATAPDAAPNAFYARAKGGGVEAVAPSPAATDDAAAAALWDQTDAWTGGALGAALEAPPRHGAGLFARVPLPDCDRGEAL